jgi:hypothetical protein
LRDLLGSHPNITVFPESHFFDNLDASRPVARRLRLASMRAPQRLRRFLSKLEDPPEFALPRLPLRRSYVRYFVRILDDVASRRGTTVWVEKTPDHLPHVDLIESLVPKARFLHIVRSGEDVVASLYELAQTSPEPWWRRRYPTIDDCVRAWTAAIKLTLSQVSKPNHALVFYEDLVTLPEPELRRVCSFLGIVFDAGMVSSTQIRYDPHSKFNRLFTEEEQVHIMESLPSLDELRSGNFEPAGSGSNAGESGSAAVFRGDERTQ